MKARGRLALMLALALAAGTATAGFAAPCVKMVAAHCCCGPSRPVTTDCDMLHCRQPADRPMHVALLPSPDAGMPAVMTATPIIRLSLATTSAPYHRAVTPYAAPPPYLLDCVFRL